MNTHTLNHIYRKYSITKPKDQVILNDKSKDLLYFVSMVKSKSDNSAVAFIKRARAKMGLTQEKFGELFDCGKSNVSGWEKGRHIPPYKVLYLMAEKSGIPLPNGLIQDEDLNAKVYRTSDPQKQRIIEMLFQIGEQDICDHIENAVRMSLGLELAHKNNRRTEAERRKEEERSEKYPEKRSTKDRRKSPHNHPGGSGGNLN